MTSLYLYNPKSKEAVRRSKEFREQNVLNSVAWPLSRMLDLNRCCDIIYLDAGKKVGETRFGFLLERCKVLFDVGKNGDIMVFRGEYEGRVNNVDSKAD